MWVEMKIFKMVKKKRTGVTNDNTLNFATHLVNITKNANSQLNAPARVQKYMTIEQKIFIFYSFLNLSFLSFIKMDVLNKTTISVE